jgi:hypothetical protein
MVVVLSLVALVLIGGSAYLLRDRFFASTNTDLGAKSFNIKVVDAAGAGVKDAEVAVVFAPTGDVNAQTYFLDPTKADTLKTQQFATNLTADEITHIKADPLAALTDSAYNNKITNPFDESQTFEDWGAAWYTHHTGGNAGCTIEPCFSNLNVIKFTNKEDKTTGSDGILQFKLSYLGQMMNKMVNNHWTAVRVYVHYNGLTTAQNLSDGTFAPDILAAAQAGTGNITIKLPSTNLATVQDGDAGISVLVKNLQDQPVQGATVKLTLKCYKNGNEVYSSDTADSAPLTLTSGADGIAKLTALDWETNIVKKLGPANTNGCPKVTAATEDSQPEGKLTKSLSVRAFYGVDERTAPFVTHGPYPFAYNGSYADSFYVNTSADATGFADPLGTGDTKAAPVFTEALTNTHPLTDGKMAYGDHATLEWAATGTAICKIENVPFGATGSWTSPAVIANKDYSVTCYNGSLETTSTVSVAVGPNPETSVTSGDGLTATWYNNSLDMSQGAFASQTVKVIDFTPSAGANTAAVSAKFTGFIRPPASGDYTFKVTVDDGARLLIDGVNILPADAWGDHSSVVFTSSPVSLSNVISHKIEVNYYNNRNVGNLKVEWAGPGIAGGKAGDTVLKYAVVGSQYLFTTNPLAAAEANVCDSTSWTKDATKAEIAEEVAEGLVAGHAVTIIPAACENKSIVIKNVVVNGDSVASIADGKRHFDNVLITEGAIVTHSSASADYTVDATKKIDWVLNGDLTINGGAKIDVTGKGYPGGVAGTKNATTGAPVCSLTSTATKDGIGTQHTQGGGKGVSGAGQNYAGSGANAGNGGTNGTGLGGVAYQTISNAESVFEFGSGGGAAEVQGSGCFNGGAGGGRVRIIAKGIISVVGSSGIYANGAPSLPITNTNSLASYIYIVFGRHDLLFSTIAAETAAGVPTTLGDYTGVMGGSGAGGTIILGAKSYLSFGRRGDSSGAGIPYNDGYQGSAGATIGSMDQSIQARGGDVPTFSASNIKYTGAPHATTGGGGIVIVK